MFATHHTRGFGVLPRKGLLRTGLVTAAGQLVSALQYTPLISTHGVGFTSSSRTRRRNMHRQLLIWMALCRPGFLTDHGCFIGRRFSKRKREEPYRKECLLSGEHGCFDRSLRESMTTVGRGMSGVFLGNVFCASCLSRETNLWEPLRSWLTASSCLCERPLSYVPQIYKGFWPRAYPFGLFVPTVGD